MSAFIHLKTGQPVYVMPLRSRHIDRSVASALMMNKGVVSVYNPHRINIITPVTEILFTLRVACLCVCVCDDNDTKAETRFARMIRCARKASFESI